MIKKWIIMLACLPMLWACDTNEMSGPVYDPSDIQPVDSFLDVRDGQKYGCVRIGNQIWMTRNLAYYLPEGSYGDCCTWDEKKLKLDDVKISVEDWCNCAQAVLDDPAYDWAAQGVNVDEIRDLLTWVVDDYTAEYMLSTFQTGYPAFYEVFSQKLDEATVAAVPQYALPHTQEAESKNGGYAAEYGYLYGYNAALKAVPEGWRLPTDEDWCNLERTLGMSESEIKKFHVWRGNGQGDLLKYGGAAGFYTRLGGGNVFDTSNAPVYIRKEENAYFWSSTKIAENDSTELAIIRSIAIFSDGILRTTSRIDNGYRSMMYSVRCVKDVD